MEPKASARRADAASCPPHWADLWRTNKRRAQRKKTPAFSPGFQARQYKGNAGE